MGRLEFLYGTTIILWRHGVFLPVHIVILMYYIRVLLYLTIRRFNRVGLKENDILLKKKTLFHVCIQKHICFSKEIENNCSRNFRIEINLAGTIIIIIACILMNLTRLTDK